MDKAESIKITEGKIRKKSLIFHIHGHYKDKFYISENS